MTRLIFSQWSIYEEVTNLYLFINKHNRHRPAEEVVGRGCVAITVIRGATHGL